MDSETKKNLQYEKMTTKPIPKLIGTLAIPTIISMMVTNIYNLVDTAFVGRLGNSASGAVGIVFGYMSILQAVGFMCGQGAGSVMSRRLGAKDSEGATAYSSTGFFLSLLLGGIIGILSYIFLTPLVHILGSTKTIEPYAKSYIIYIIISAPFFTSSLTLNNLLRYEGRARLGTIGLMTGAAINIGGDMLFMFGMNMGISGAGLSTALSQTISFIILLAMFLTGRTETKISIHRISHTFAVPGNIMATGFPSLIRQSLNSIATMLLNGQSAIYGDAAVAAMSNTSRIAFFMMAVAIGMGQGFQPVSSYNYGAGKYDRVKKAFWFTVAAAEVLLLIIIIPVYIKSDFFLSLLRDDSEVLSYGIRALRLQCITLMFVPLTMMTEMGFQSTGQRALAIFASSLRSGLIFIPVLLILSALRGMSGIQEAQPVGYVISFIISLFLSRIFMKKLDKLSKN